MIAAISTLLAETESYKIVYAFGTILGFIIMLAIPILFILSLVKVILTKRKRWIVILVITTLCACGFVGMVGFTAFNSFQKSRGATAEDMIGENKKTRVVSTDDKLLQMEIPEVWSEIDDLSEIASLEYGHLTGEQYLIVISEEKVDFDEALTLKGYGQACLENTKEVASKYKEGKWVASEAAGNDMLEIEVDAVVDNIKIKYLHGYYETENHYHQVMQWSLSSKWERSRPVFEAVLDSVKPVE